MSELATYDAPKPALLRPIAAPADVIDAHKALTAFVNEALEEGKDFGVIPGTNDKRMTLLKAGAERLTAGFGLRPDFDVLEQDVVHDYETRYSMTKWVSARVPEAEQQRLIAEGIGRNRTSKNGGTYFQKAEVEAGTSLGLYRYVIRCRLYSHDGREVGQGVGSCSSMESKYIRQPRDSENTIIKMAKKRAFVDAVLTTLGLSDRFTQDAEDIHEATSIDGEVVEESAGQRVVSATGPAVAEPQYVRPRNWLTLERECNIEENDEATLFMKAVIGKERFQEFKSACDKIDFRFAALACKDRQLTTPEQCIVFIRDGVLPEPVVVAEVVEDPKANAAEPSAKPHPADLSDSSASTMRTSTTTAATTEDDPFEFEPQTHHQYDGSCTTETGDRFAFGWKPYRWPKPTAMNAQPATEMADLGQRCRALADVRNIAPERFDSVRAALCR